MLQGKSARSQLSVCISASRRARDQRASSWHARALSILEIRRAGEKISDYLRTQRIALLGPYVLCRAIGHPPGSRTFIMLASPWTDPWSSVTDKTFGLSAWDA